MDDISVADGLEAHGTPSTTWMAHKNSSPARYRPRLSAILQYACMQTSQLLLCAGLAYVCHRFATFTRWGDELKHVRKFILVIFVAIVELLIENYCSWYFPSL